MTTVKIAYDQLSTVALNGVVEEYVTRDGTDYGEIEFSLETKKNQVLGQLERKEAFIVFDHQSETCTILHRDDPALKELSS